MTAPGYAPIDCAVHDRLEHWAVRRTPVEVVWRGNGGERAATTTVDDVAARDGADWVRLGSGVEVRADRLVSVGGVDVGGCEAGLP